MYFYFQIDDVVKDVVIEDFLEKYIIKTEVDEEIMEIVKEVFDHYDAKIARQELRAVSNIHHFGNRFQMLMVIFPQLNS